MTGGSATIETNGSCCALAVSPRSLAYFYYPSGYVVYPYNEVYITVALTIPTIRFDGVVGPV